MRRLLLASALMAALAACKPAAEAPAPVAAPEAAPVAAQPAAPAAAPAVAMRAYGNEPFWEIIDDGKGTLTFSTPDNTDGEKFAATRSEDASGIHYVGADVKLDIVKKDCEDTMADGVKSPYTAAMTLKGKTYSGCAAPASDLMPVEEAGPNPTAAAGAASDGPVTKFSANGFSPAWRAEVDGESVKLDVPEHNRVDPGFTTLKATRSASAKTVEFSGKDGATDFTLIIDGRTRCNKAGDADGKTDREFHATLVYGKTTYKGCADAK